MKLVLTSICALAITSSVFAQGNVNWTGPAFSAMTAQTNSTTYSPLFGGGSTGSGSVGATALGGPGFYYELLYTSYSGVQATIPSLASLLAWTDTGLGATNNASGTAGRLNDIAPNSGAQVPWSPGTTNSIVLVGWSANLGTTWSSVSNVLANWSTQGIVNAFFGTSTTGYITPLSTSTSPGAAVFGTAATAQGLPINSLNTQLYLIPVPEPGTIALATLGGLSMLALRRRKA